MTGFRSRLKFSLRTLLIAVLLAGLITKGEPQLYEYLWPNFDQRLPPRNRNVELYDPWADKVISPFPPVVDSLEKCQSPLDS